jgi:hypothetical protein
VLVFILAGFALIACASTSRTSSPVPSGGADATGFPSQTPTTTPSPTLEPDENSREIRRSMYYEKVELLESASIPLQTGDDDYTIRSTVIHDIDEDGSADAILTMATYPDNISHPIIILNGEGPIENIARNVFPGGIPSIVHSNQIFFEDIDKDGLEDLLISEAGLDHPPWLNPDALVGIAMNRGAGVFEDVSETVPQAAKGLRNYSLAAGDLYNDGIIRILLPSQAITGEDPNYSGPEKSGLLFWNGSEFVFQQNWIDLSLWWWPTNLYASSFMSVQDIDGDGWQDLYISGSWTTPNHRVIFGDDAFPSEESLTTLPEGPYGHTTWEAFMQSDIDFVQGSDVNRVVFEDFDRDGDLDIVSIMEDVKFYKPGVFMDEVHPWFEDVSENGGAIYGNVWFQVIRNEGERHFVEVTAQGRDLGYRYYIGLHPLDVDLDGYTDLVGQFWGKSPADACEPLWSSTIFINEGNLVFRTVEIEEVFPELSSEGVQVPWETDCVAHGLGVLFPTVITTERTSGLFVYPLEIDPTQPALRVQRFHATGRFRIPE